jgi:hypothetical protein
MYALKCLKAKAPLEIYEGALTIAKGASCPALYGHTFETLVHKVFSMSDMAVTFHLCNVPRPLAKGRKTTSTTSQDIDIDIGIDINNSDGYDEQIRLSNVTAGCVGATLAEAKRHLGGRIMDLERTTYWFPDFPSFPVIDAVACVPSVKTVLYIQLTVGKERVVQLADLVPIHNLVKQSLEKSLRKSRGNTTVEDWTFRYVAIEPSQDAADALDLDLMGFGAGTGTGTGTVTEECMDGDGDGDGEMKAAVSWGKGYVTYSAA